VNAIALAAFGTQESQVQILSPRLEALLTPFAAAMPGVFLFHSGRRQVLPKLCSLIEHVKYQRANAPAIEQVRESS